MLVGRDFGNALEGEADTNSVKIGMIVQETVVVALAPA